MGRYYYKSAIDDYLREGAEAVLGKIVSQHSFNLTPQQRDAWIRQSEILKNALETLQGTIYFEFSIPRMGKRVDAVVLLGPAIFVIEFKVGQSAFLSQDLEQVMDYALDLAHFHEGSHQQAIIPILVATEAPTSKVGTHLKLAKDRLYEPLKTNAEDLPQVFQRSLAELQGPHIVHEAWEASGYKPTPTIVEAALALYASHSVVEISRSDAGAINLAQTSGSVSEIIRRSREQGEKVICFVTGVPGAGKTLVGLNIATTHIEKDDLHSVYLSGNGPLVAVLQEALARDKVRRDKEAGVKARMGEARSEVKAFVQAVHHFRDEGLIDEIKAPPEHVVIFDEAQRAWNIEQTRNFMKRKRNRPDFGMSEPEFLISCMDRHRDWAVIVCLVGGGQEINTGEAGIGEWLEALNRSFGQWKIYVSDQLSDAEFGAGRARELLSSHGAVNYLPELHLKTSMRSFKSENVSAFVKRLLDLEIESALEAIHTFRSDFPIVLSRDLEKAKAWLRKQAKGSERYGIVASSKAARLRPHALDVKSKASPVHWFLNGKEDVRSSFFLEEVATEFDVQGLELDWACVAWDADFRFNGKSWETFEFTAVPGKPLMRWTHIRKDERKAYLKNAYRVLLTRARQGMVLLVPEGSSEDKTRKSEYYDKTFDYLASFGMELIQ